MSTWIVRELSHGRGLRVAVKDLIDMAGLPTTAGCLALARGGVPAEADAPCLTGFRAAEAKGDARFVGKTNLHELAYGISGINQGFGTPRNPFDPSLVPGGSSSGSAVAVAEDEADIAFGSDTGGSVRIPAACCGVAGLKTTWGRIPLEGVWPLAPSLDTIGPIARDVAGLTAGMALLEPGFTIAEKGPVTVGRLALNAEPEIDQAVDRALGETGWEPARIELDGLDGANRAAMTLIGAEAWGCDRALVQASSPGDIGSDVLSRLRWASSLSQADVKQAELVRAHWIEKLGAIFDRVDLLALPTLLGFPPRISDAARLATLRGPTAVVNLVGLPALAIPIPSGGPLPASLQLVGPAGSEDRLLAAGLEVEAALA